MDVRIRPAGSDGQEDRSCFFCDGSLSTSKMLGEVEDHGKSLGLACETCIFLGEATMRNGLRGRIMMKEQEASKLLSDGALDQANRIARDAFRLKQLSEDPIKVIYGTDHS
jgi:hypothetical protein